MEQAAPADPTGLEWAAPAGHHCGVGPHHQDGLENLPGFQAEDALLSGQGIFPDFILSVPTSRDRATQSTPKETVKASKTKIIHI